MEMADTALVAADAVADVVELSEACLVGHFRIRDHGAGHATHVCLPLLEDSLRLVRLGDASGDENGAREDLLDLGGMGHGIAMFEGHGRHDMG
jgi:hypothetical protein